MSKKWGSTDFWGLGNEWDFDYLLTESQRDLRDKLVELCRTKIRPHSIECDKNYTFPRASLDALSELGLLGLNIPKELGGLGETHLYCAVITETIARYGCPSTALVYTMHLTACSMIIFRHHNNDHIKDLLRRVNKEKLVGTSVHSDPSTGGHFWYPLSSKSKMLSDQLIRVSKTGAWATSAGHADWYAMETLSPQFNGKFSDLSIFIAYKDEGRANCDDWSALGLHGNQSAPLFIDSNIPVERLVGPIGDGEKNNSEVAGIFFMSNSSAVWNGISLSCMDVAKKHVTRKAHADAGMRICDYPIIQDYFGRSICDTNNCRGFLFTVCQQLDRVTNNCDWSIHQDLEAMPRSPYGFYLWQTKYNTSENVITVSDRMMKACGGTGYKTELGLERLFRDGRAGAVMGQTNEVVSLFLGKAALQGMEALDFWEERYNKRILHHEVSKMKAQDKRVLAEQLLLEADQEEAKVQAHPEQDQDFDNPFNTQSARSLKEYKDKNGTLHKPGLNCESFTSLTLESKREINDKLTSFVFKFDEGTDHTGCYPGQYIQVCCDVDGRSHHRFLSPVSAPDDYGKMEIVMRYETHGIVSTCFRNLDIGGTMRFRGPCGGFEYFPNTLDELSILVAGAGVTPGIQLLRCVANNPEDKTRVNLMYFSETIDDIIYYKELENLSGDPRINVFHTLGEPPEDWEGGEGYIDTQMIKKTISEPNSKKHQMIVCGGVTMTISCLNSIKDLGYPSKGIYIYGQYGTELIRSVFGRNAALSTHSSDI